MNIYEEVFYCKDLFELISNNLHYAEISGLGLISKKFLKNVNPIYEKRLKKDIIDPVLYLQKELIENINSVFNDYKISNISEFYFEKIVNKYNKIYTVINGVLYYNENFRDNKLKTIKIKNYFIDFVYKIVKNYWIVLVKNLDLMEIIFLNLANINYFCNSQNINNFYVNENIVNYLYVENSNKFKVFELKRMAQYKKIPKSYKMKRNNLIKNLKRPEDEVYLFDTEH